MRMYRRSRTARCQTSALPPGSLASGAQIERSRCVFVTSCLCANRATHKASGWRMVRGEIAPRPSCAAAAPVPAKAQDRKRGCGNCILERQDDGLLHRPLAILQQQIGFLAPRSWMTAALGFLVSSIARGDDLQGGQPVSAASAPTEARIKASHTLAVNTGTGGDGERSSAAKPCLPVSSSIHHRPGVRHGPVIISKIRKNLSPSSNAAEHAPSAYQRRESSQIWQASSSQRSLRDGSRRRAIAQIAEELDLMLVPAKIPRRCRHG